MRNAWERERFFGGTLWLCLGGEEHERSREIGWKGKVQRKEREKRWMEMLCEPLSLAVVTRSLSHDRKKAEFSLRRACFSVRVHSFALSEAKHNISMKNVFQVLKVSLFGRVKIFISRSAEKT